MTLSVELFVVHCNLVSGHLQLARDAGYLHSKHAHLKMSLGSLDLLAAAFTAMLGVEVVTPEVGAQLGIPKLSIHHLFRATYIMRPLQSVDPGQVFEINVKTLTGTTIVVQVTNEFTISEVKASIELKEKIPPHQQRLIYNSKRLQDEETIGGLGIPPHGTLFLVLVLRGGGASFQLDPDELAPDYNYDFRGQKDDGKHYIRGGYEYHRPYGWFRYAIKVLGRSEYGGDDTWLGPNGIRTESSASEWPVSYHGTSMEHVSEIVKHGYKIGSRNMYGKGVYSSPSLEMVEKQYAQKFTFGGVNYKVALQNRVNPDPSHLEIVDKSDTGAGADYWVCKLHDPDKGVYDVRPYGILILKF